jgi:hypothetical protein
MSFAMAIAPIRFYSATQMPTGLVNLKDENQPPLFCFSSVVDQYRLAVVVNEQWLYLPEMLSSTQHERAQKNPSG